MKTPPDVTSVARGTVGEGFMLGTRCCAGLLGRSRPLCGHLGHARIAKRVIYWPHRSSPTGLANRHANHPESFMNYPG